MKRITCLSLAVLIIFVMGCQLPDIPLDPPASRPDSFHSLLTLPPETDDSATTAAESLPLLPETDASETEAPSTHPLETEPPPQGFDGMDLAMTLPLEARVGQMFLARCPAKGALADIASYHLGGYLLFAQDFQNRMPDEVRDVIAGYQSASTIPMLIAVDEEGGTVTRVSRYSQFRDKKFDSPRNLYQKGGLDLLLSTEVEKCALLSSLGINLNLAPVCDITTNPKAFLYHRSLGLSPEETGSVIAAMIRTMKENGIASSMKHFPGYGNNADTHIGIAVDQRPLAELESLDLVPFRAGIETGCGIIMVSHTYINAIDPALPASLSPIVVSYLRNEMGFGGVILTDDLVMDAISKQYGADRAAVLAVLAGNDLLCSSEYELQYNAVLEAVKRGEIPEDLVNRACARILTLKHEMGLL